MGGELMASIDPKFKIVGPFSPKQFSDTTTLATTIDTAVGTLTGASSTTSLIAAEPVIVLGQAFIVLTYV
jgi:hypothetical protein|tara:strand:- start:348 stop:557 length:210 start_codon:yes stop_codon:yes gene_type:complete